MPYRLSLYLKLVLYSFCLIHSVAAVSQELQNPIDTIIISELKLNSSIWNESIDSSLTHSIETFNLAEALKENTNIFIRQNGSFGVSGLSIRGTSAIQSSILWNGMKIQQPMLGTYDLNLIPSNFSNEIVIDEKGTTDIWGSAIGGVVKLNSQPLGTNFSLLNLHTASFGERQCTFASNVSMGNYKIHTKIFGQNNRNDFTFLNDVGEEEKLENADIQRFGLSQDHFLDINPENELNFHIWFMNSDQNLPAIPFSAANQKDQAIWLNLGWNNTNSKLPFYARLGFQRDRLDFEDIDMFFPSNSTTKNLLSEIGFKKVINKVLRIESQLSNTVLTADTDLFPEKIRENRLASFSSLSFISRDGKLSANAGLRLERIEEKGSPILPTLRIEYRTNSVLHFGLDLHKAYRVPTFNELYFPNFGNPDLKPEESWNFDLSSVIQNEKGSSFRISVFNRTIDDLIAFSVDDAGSFAPFNVAKVWSRGLECNLRQEIRLGQVLAIPNFAYEFVQSTNQEDYITAEDIEGKNIPFVPKHKLSFSTNFFFKKIHAKYRMEHVGSRFSDPQNTLDLPSYTLSNIKVEYPFSLNTIDITVGVETKNLFDTSYEIISPYPQKGRTIGANLAFKF